MSRYHVNPETGEPGPCRAQKSCPFGDMESDHYDSKESARKAYEDSMADSATVSHSAPTTGWLTRDEARLELGMTRYEFVEAEKSGDLKFVGPENDAVLGRDIDAYREKIASRTAAQGLTQGTTEYKSVVIAHAQRVSNESGKHPETVSVLVPDVKRLTDKKKLEIGREIWTFSGRDPEVWDKGDDAAKLGWAQIRMGSGRDTEVIVKNDRVSWVTSETVSSNYKLENVKLI